MGVMTQMRDRAAVILFILLVLFVLSMTVGGLVGGANILDIITGKHPDAIGIVNGKEIKVRTFNEAYTNQLENYRNRTGNEPTESQLDFIRNQVWDSLVRDILIQQVLRQEHIKASDAEIVYRIFNDPPDILRSNPAFQNDQKQFDMAKYQAALNDPSLARQWRPVEDLLRATLPYEELQDRIVSSVRVTDDE
ncbi:MAG: SurA N-terminal domain-containing protein, partial [bacterium]